MTSDQQLKELENTLWKAAEWLWSHGWLKPSEYTFPVLGLIFLKYADAKFQATKKKLEANQKTDRFGTIDPLSQLDFKKEGVLFVPEEASYNYLLNQPGHADYGKLINQAMTAIEKENEELTWVLPKQYWLISNDNIIRLLKTFSTLDQIEGDNFGLIYEFFMGNFEKEAGQKGGEFFTPRSLVKLIIEIIEPYKGTIFDPACGSGWMFVQSLNYIKEHKNSDIINAISVSWQEIKTQTIKMAKMNLAINGLEWKINEANTMYENTFDSVGKFDYVTANPPFNLKGIDKDKLKNDPRYPYGIPTTDNANYLWISIFASSLNETWRAWFVMSSQAGDAGKGEMTIRKEIIDSGIVDVMVSVWPNFFYTVTLPCSLWFFNKGKTKTDKKNKILFIDAKDIYRDIDRSHREFTEDQIHLLSDIVRIYRWEKVDPSHELTKQYFPDGKYQDILGLCKVEDKAKVEENNYSLNPWRYVGITEKDEPDYDFHEKLGELNNEFIELTDQSHELEKWIIEDMKKLLIK